jgi:hypothetical protein
MGLLELPELVLLVLFEFAPELIAPGPLPGYALPG